MPHTLNMSYVYMQVTKQLQEAEEVTAEFTKQSEYSLGAELDC